MRGYAGFVDTLLDAHNTGRGLWAFCRNCGHAKLMKPWDLIRGLKTGTAETIRLTDFGQRFVCKKCSHHATILIPAAGLGHGYGGVGRR